MAPVKPLIRVAADDTSALLAQLRQAVLVDEAALAVLPVAGDIEPSGDDLIAAHVPRDVAVVVETSGSTDAPKRVMLSAAALRASAGATEQWFGGHHGQWLLALPATYIAGVQVLVRSILAGTEPVVLGQGHFDPRAFAAASAQLDPARARFTSLVPVQLARLVQAAADDAAVADALRSFDRILLGGQAAPAGLVERAAALGAVVHRTYGSSETAGGCVYDGMPLPGVGVRIVDGEVQLSGAMLASGYLDDPERTAVAFTTDADGTRWYRTGDLGELAPDGRLRISGRADDVVISGGVKVALGEVERAVRCRLVEGGNSLDLEHTVLLPTVVADRHLQRLARLGAVIDANSELPWEFVDSAGGRRRRLDPHVKRVRSVRRAVLRRGGHPDSEFEPEAVTADPQEVEHRVASGVRHGYPQSLRARLGALIDVRPNVERQGLQHKGCRRG